MNGYPINDDAATWSRYGLWLRCPTNADDTSWGLAVARFPLAGDAADYSVIDFGSEYVAWDSEEFSRSLPACCGSERSHPKNYGLDNEGLSGWGTSSPADEWLEVTV